MSTCNWLDLETLGGFWPIIEPENPPLDANCYLQIKWRGEGCVAPNHLMSLPGQAWVAPQTFVPNYSTQMQCTQTLSGPANKTSILV